MLLLSACESDSSSTSWSRDFFSITPFYPCECSRQLLVPSLKDSLFIIEAVDVHSGEVAWTWDISREEVGTLYYNLTISCSDVAAMVPLGRLLVVLDVKSGKLIDKRGVPNPINHTVQVGSESLAASIFDTAATYTYIYRPRTGIEIDTLPIHGVWKTFPPLNEEIQTIPVVVRRGRGHALSSIVSKDGLEAKSTVVYEDTKLGKCFSKPPIIDGSVAYLVAVDVLYKINAEGGTVVWMTKMPAGMVSSHVFLQGDFVYFQADDLNLYQIDQLDGRIVKKVRTGSMIGRWSRSTGGWYAIDPIQQVLLQVDSDLQTVESWTSKGVAPMKRVCYFDDDVFAFYEGDTLRIATLSQFDDFFRPAD